MKHLIILRGLPGSGKTTLAGILSDGRYPVYSVDDYFTDEQGNYHFDFKENYLAYKQCEEQTKASMIAGVSKIFIHNTFTIAWETEPYFKMAAEFGYQVHVVTVENYHNGKNRHAITEEQLQKMADKYKVKLL